MKSKTSTETIITHSNDLIESRMGKLTLLQMKFWLYVIGMVDNTDDTDTCYRIWKKDFLLDVGGKKGMERYMELRTSIKRLQSVVITLKNGDEEVDTHLLNDVSWNIKKPYIDVTIPDVLKPHIYRLKSEYTMYNLLNVVEMTSIFGIRLYQLLKQYERIGKRGFDLIDLKYKLNVEDKYKDYYMFKKRILNVGVKEINLKSDIEVDYDEIKKGKGVVGIKFSIRKNIKKSKEITKQITELSKGKKVPLTRLRESNPKYYDMLHSLGMTDSLISRTMNNNSYDYVRYIVLRVKEESRLGKVKNVGGYVNVCIVEDFFLSDYNKSIRIKKSEEKNKNILKRKETQQIVLSQTHKLFIKEKNSKVDEVIQIMNEDTYLDDFLLSVEDNGLYNNIVSNIRNEGTNGYYSYKEYVTLKIMGETYSSFPRWFKTKYGIDIFHKDGEWMVKGNMDKFIKLFGES